MQHHATPTRLLDWSENALVALAFATQYRSNRHKGKDATVWCLNPIKLNEHVRFSAYDDEPIPNICDNKELQTMFESPRQTTPLQLLDRKILIEFSLSVEYLRCSPIKIHLI